MRLNEAERLKIEAQLDLCRREADRLHQVEERLFARPIAAATLASLDDDPALSEQIDAFGARFGRLQDAIGEKLLPAYFAAAQEPPRAMRDVLDRAERLGLIESAERWIQTRRLRNRLVHEYVRDRAMLAASLLEARASIGLLIHALNALSDAFTPYITLPRS